jgi:glycosyltransferase involved in cell wall biosynthesis
MKLLVVTQTLDTRDPVLGFFHRWIEEFSKKFETVTVIALSTGEYTLPENVRVHSLGKEKGSGKFSRMLKYVSLLYSLRNEYTHVFVHMNPEYVIGGGMLWRALGKKTALWYVHGKVSWRLKLAVQFVDRIFTASKESCRIQSGKIRVVGHGIDTDMFSPKNIAHPPSVISAGRFSPSKHLDVLVAAMQKVKERIPEAVLRIIGSAGTPEEKEYEQKIRHAAEKAGVLAEKPILHSDMPSVLALSDVFLNASTTNSLDKAVLEAMSAGVVPVTSNISFKPMLSEYGLFIGHTPLAFAERTMELLQNDAERIRLSKEVRDIIVREHSLPRLIAILKEDFDRLKR